MPNRLASAVSPYLRAHADNPVDWQQWGQEPFAEAVLRDVPVLVSIGYSTCHWCHVMARESFSDPTLAAFLNDNFVAIKVDREEYPDVDSSYLAAASVFTGNLGWPLNVFVTPRGRAFYAGTYWPPTPMLGHPSFRQVLGAMHDAWRDRRDEVESNASTVVEALAAQGRRTAGELPDGAALDAAVDELIAYEDAEFGGFGTAPKFPMAPVLDFLLTVGGVSGTSGTSADADAATSTRVNGTSTTSTRASTDSVATKGARRALALAERTLVAMAASDLRDPIEGGFFRYSTQRDWTDPHYERMLYDNAQLLRAYTLFGTAEPERAGLAAEIVGAVAGYLIGVMQLPSGGFASAQDSESTVDGERVEGEYYRLDATARAGQTPPALDEKVLTGWNGLAIDALALAGFAYRRPEWTAAARRAADHLIARHLRADGTLVRASIGDVVSAAVATLEDYGLFASGLLQLATATGELRYASAARTLVDDCMAGGSGVPFGAPGGADAVLVQHGLALAADPSEGVYPSGLSAMAAAAHRLYLLTAHAPYLAASVRAMQLVAPIAVARPASFGASLAMMSALAAPTSQLVVVGEDAESPVASVARSWRGGRGVVAVLTSAQAAEFARAGFELFDGRTAQAGQPTAYLCRDFVCQLPLTDADALVTELASR